MSGDDFTIVKRQYRGQMRKVVLDGNGKRACVADLDVPDDKLISDMQSVRRALREAGPKIADIMGLDHKGTP